MSKKKNTQIATIAPDFFKDVNFSALNATIEELGKNNKTLDPDEKKCAIELIDTWNKTILDELRQKQQEASNYLNGLSVNLCAYYSLEDEFLKPLAFACGCDAEYMAYKLATEKAIEFAGQKPEPPVAGLDNTIDEDVTMQSNYQLKETKYNIEMAKLNNKANIAYKKLVFAMNEQPTIKEFISRLNKFNRQFDKLVGECEKKAQMAKLNVMISSEKIRQTMTELLDFKLF